MLWPSTTLVPNRRQFGIYFKEQDTLQWASSHIKSLWLFKNLHILKENYSEFNVSAKICLEVLKKRGLDMEV